MPHEVVIDLGREMPLQGITLLPRQDKSNGRIAQAEIFTGARIGERSAPAATLHARDSHQLETLRFGQIVNARFLRVVVKSEVSGQPFAALAELDIVSASQ